MPVSASVIRVQIMKYVAIGENHLYAKAYAKGKKHVGRLAAVYVLPDYAAKRLQKAHPQKLKMNRIGLTVSKKLGGAVVRNRVKRIIRHAYKEIDTERGVKCGFLIVIVARSAAVGAKTQHIKKDLEKALSRLDMLV